jgi:hypothetical protein
MPAVQAAREAGRRVARVAMTVPTLKNVVFTSEDSYRREKMIAMLQNRGMLTPYAENYIRRKW